MLYRSKPDDYEKQEHAIISFALPRKSGILLDFCPFAAIQESVFGTAVSDWRGIRYTFYIIQAGERGRYAPPKTYNYQIVVEAGKCGIQ